MNRDGLMAGIGFVARLLELFGVAVIAVAFVHGTSRELVRVVRKREGAYERLKHHLGQSLLLGLEFLIAADIIRTVTIEATIEGLLSLGLLVVVRIVLGWSIAVEMTGCWPWQQAARK